MKDKYRVVTNAIITHRGKILLGKKEEKEGHPVSGEWHFPGGHLDEGEEPEEAVIREVKEETGLEGKVHQLVDVTSNSDSNSPSQIFYHVEVSSNEAESKEDLSDVKWINPANIKSEIGKTYSKRIEKRDEIKDFIERIEKAPY